MVAIRNGLLRYSVQGRLQLAIIPAIKEMGNPITHITWPLKCKGTWVRKIIKVGRMFKPSLCLTSITGYT